MAGIFAAGLDFIVPRILVAVSVRQLALWGLRALTALDPALVPVADAGRLRLFLGARLLYDAPVLQPDDADGWGEAVAEMTQAAWTASPAVRKAGQQAIVTNFFDELFDPLDPYSRYVSPARAEIERTELDGGEGRTSGTIGPRRDFRTVFPEFHAGLLVLRLTRFADRTGKDLEVALVKGLSRRRPRGVVLDLRGNRGGVLIQAVDVAAAVLGSGLVATTVGRDPAADRTFEVDQVDRTGGLPVIVLVDGGTASAAEVVAAALADDRRAVVVGSETQGKGLAQTAAELPDGGELFVTWARILAPLGWPIEGLGVLPQLCTSRGELDLERQIALLRRGREPMAKAIAVNRTASPEIPVASVLAVREACPAAQGRGDLDLIAARFLASHPAAYAAAMIPPQLLSPGLVAPSH